jgi:hypothetical protein
MLEQEQLLLRPWVPLPGSFRQDGGGTRPEPVETWRRAVLDPATREELGHGRWHLAGVAGWLIWLARPVLQVFETEDASLLLTARRGWGPLSRWRVEDADGKPVGAFGHDGVTLRAPGSTAPLDMKARRLPATWIADPSGCSFVRLEAATDETRERFVTNEGNELATLHRSPEGDLLRFAPAADPNPFVRMLLLAAVMPL